MKYTIEKDINVVTETTVKELREFMDVNCIGMIKINKNFYIHTLNVSYLISDEDFDLDSNVYCFISEVYRIYKNFKENE
ncbi:MAG TPA: hypothetical protein EYG89_03405 [Bacteroidia bacterium]|nr:hypothetical protein [Bacteroidia bacterium]